MHKLNEKLEIFLTSACFLLNFVPVKKALAYIFVSLALLLIPVAADGEGRVYTRKMRLSDFTTRTTKVVLSGSPILDAALRDEVTMRWHLSPYEFCTVDEYNALKSKPEYYFLRLLRATSQDSRDAGLMFISLMKGGKEKNPDSLDKTFEVIRVPFAPTEYSSGREFLYMSALIDIIQEYVEDAMEADTKGYAGLSNYNIRVMKDPRKRVWISREDLGFELTPAQKDRYLGDKLLIASEDDVDRVFKYGTRNALVGIVVAPVSARKGDWCYKMLISADTHQLYYYHRHRISFNAWKGFQLSDIKAISKRSSR